LWLPPQPACNPSHFQKTKSKPPQSLQEENEQGVCAIIFFFKKLKVNSLADAKKELLF